jgi:hypothetical protein
MSPKINKLQLLTFLDKGDIIDISTKEITMKQTYSISYDNNFLQRKLDHYNAWLLNPKRKVEDGPYQGFPEEVDRAAKLAKGRAIMEAERAAKPVKPAKVVKTKVAAKENSSKQLRTRTCTVNFSTGTGTGRSRSARQSTYAAR